VEYFTDKNYWQNYWQHNSSDSLEPFSFEGKYRKEMLTPFDKFLSNERNLSVLEIGGFPGTFIMALCQRYSIKRIGILDYYFDNAEEIAKCFSKEGYDLEMYKKDLFEDDLGDIAPFDVVVSMGLAEHYSDVEKTARKHLECLKKDGVLIIGMPALLGINKWLAKFFFPEVLATHNLSTMGNKKWEQLSEKLEVELLYSKYIGGFNPHAHNRLEKPTYFRRVCYIVFYKVFAKIWDIIPFTVSINSKYLSFYYYAVYKKVK
jgi:SAM-dependent methyltransferase